MSNTDEKKNDYPSTSVLSRLGLTAIICIAGGLFLLIMQTIAQKGVLGFIVGGIACVLGIVSMLSKDSADKKAGLLIGIAGLLVLISKTKIPYVASVSGILIIIAAAGLLFLGIWSAIKFFIGLKKRA